MTTIDTKEEKLRPISNYSDSNNFGYLSNFRFDLYSKFGSRYLVDGHTFSLPNMVCFNIQHFFSSSNLHKCGERNLSEFVNHSSRVISKYSKISSKYLCGNSPSYLSTNIKPSSRVIFLLR